MTKDILKWEKFYQHSNLNYIKIPNKISKYNRLLLHTNNFFLIAGYGCFNEGYLLLLPKKLISSFAQLDSKLIKEFNFSLIQKNNKHHNSLKCLIYCKSKLDNRLRIEFSKIEENFDRVIETYQKCFYHI